MSKPTLGLDIGGANLKAVHSSGQARAVPFALWKYPERLGTELKRLCDSVPAFDRLAVTMTGELCDCFETKREGVKAILRAVRTVAGTTAIWVWTTGGRFLTLEEANEKPLSAAAANWLALGYFVGRHFPTENVVLMDTGSTTTDIVYLRQGIPEPRGRTDRERLETGELVYTGVRRTPICSVLGMSVAAEFFATMHDAYVVAGLLPEEPDNCDTADGRPATRENARARLARMRCADGETFSVGQVRALAEQALAAQWNAVHRAAASVLRDRPAVQRVVLAGSGEILGRQVAARHPLLTEATLVSLADWLGLALSESACAHAVAVLAAQEEFYA
ncbi:MAG: H4MPT-linked C1 transfer pathway protein [Planctomycetes bacterium]|nr:H4MPT-linked C1 transfer pathway protein [Planctomycetota bacterium]